MKIKIVNCDHPQYWYVDRIGETFDVSDATRTDFITEPDGHLVLRGHAEVVEEETSEWFSKGILPPVGTVCGVYHKSRDTEIKKGVLRYISEQTFVFEQEDGKEFCGITDNWTFQPFDPQKQKDIEELDKHLDKWFSEDLFDDNNILTLSQYLYNEGYRKTK